MKKSERVEARLSVEDREKIARAASLEDRSVSGFMVWAASEKAEQVIQNAMVTEAPAKYFDELVTSLDEPDAAPSLRKAARKAKGPSE